MKVLKLSAQGLPQSWISLEQAVIHYAAGEVRWEAGAEIAMFRGGHNALTAAAYLAHQGFAEVYSLDGGFELWRSQYPDQVSRSELE